MVLSLKGIPLEVTTLRPEERNNSTDAANRSTAPATPPDLEKIRALGLPFWLAGSFATPERLAKALAAGAAGIQVGTAFAFCEESGIETAFKRMVLERSLEGTLEVFTDPEASPSPRVFVEQNCRG